MFCRQILELDYENLCVCIDINKIMWEKNKKYLKIYIFNFLSIL